VIEIAEKRHLEESTSQEPEAGENVEMYPACAAQTNVECWVHRDIILDVKTTIGGGNV
jgi:hypothetical protein